MKNTLTCAVIKCSFTNKNRIDWGSQPASQAPVSSVGLRVSLWLELGCALPLRGSLSTIFAFYFLTDSSFLG